MTTVHPYAPQPEALIRYIQGLITIGRKYEAARLLHIGFGLSPLETYRVVNQEFAIEFRHGLLIIEETSNA